VQGTAFSDSLFLTATPDFGGVLNLLIALVLVGQKLLELGFLVRGGIAKGPVLHESGLVFGPGLVQAYELESGVAVYPRIVAAPEVLRSVRSVEPVPNALLAFFRDDSDGFWFLDLYEMPSLRIGSYADAPFVAETVPKRLEAVAVRLEKLRNAMAAIVEAQAPTDVRRLAKLNWAVRAFNRSLGSKEALLIEEVPTPCLTS